MSYEDLQIPRQASTLRTLVEDGLRSAIMSGRFEAGQRLVERELCEIFGVGRTSIREGLRQLEAEGLVTIVPHKGPSVSTIEYEEAEQLYATRALLESYAGEQFAERGSAAEMAALTEAVEAFEAAAESGRHDMLLLTKNKFYDVLEKGCGNVFVRQMLNLLHNRVNLLRSTSMQQPGRIPRAVAEIREIHDAIRSRDSKRAAAACRHHVEMAAEVALRRLRQKI